MLSQTQLDAQRVQDRLLKDVRAAARGRQVSIQRLAVARKQGLVIPSLEEAQSRAKAFEEEVRARREGEGKAAMREKSRGAGGVGKSGRAGESGGKTKEEKKSENKLREARRQTV